MLSKYPIDFDLVAKGDEFTVAKLQDITGKKFGTDEYRFAVMGLQALIQDRTGFTAKCTSDGGLQVLTDSEAAEHNRKLFAQNLRALGNRHQLNSQVDVENLSADQRAKHDRTLLVHSKYISAIVNTTKTITLESAKKSRQLTSE